MCFRERSPSVHSIQWLSGEDYLTCVQCWIANDIKNSFYLVKVATAFFYPRQTHHYFRMGDGVRASHLPTTYRKCSECCLCCPCASVGVATAFMGFICLWQVF